MAKLALLSAALLIPALGIRKSNSKSNVAEQATIDGCTCKSECGSSLKDLHTCDSCKTQGRCGHWAVTGRWDTCDFSLNKRFESKTYKQKISYYWGKITQNRERTQNIPNPFGAFTSSMMTVFDNYMPEMPVGRVKMIHAVASICKIGMEISSSSPFTGLLGPGMQEGFIRMGNAVPYDKGMTPGLGFKFLRSGVQSGDFVALRSLDMGQSWNFFQNNQSNHIKAATGATGVLAKKFEQASQCAVKVGLSDLARYSQDGTKHANPEFPFKLFFVPSSSPKVQMSTEEHTLEQVHAHMDSIPVGQTLYTVYACTKPLGEELDPVDGGCGGQLRLGEIKIKGDKCTRSKYGDEQFHVRHQRIEEDWQIKEEYFKQGAFNAHKSCGRKSRDVEIDGAPTCGEASMLETDM